jgi:trimeric autotransporter adhesin
MSLPLASARDTRQVFLQLRLLSLSVVATAVLAACGGSDPGAAANPPTSSQPPAPGPTAPTSAMSQPSIVSFLPTSGAPGTIVRVSGVGLDGVTGANIGGRAASFKIVSSLQVDVTVPEGAGGRISLTKGSAAALSATDFTIVSSAPPPPPPPPPPVSVPAPTVTAVSPTTVAAGGRLTVTGTALDQVASVKLGSANLTIASRSATVLVLDLPVSATSGALTLVDRANVSRSAGSVTVLAPLSVAGVSPANVARGGVLTLTGQGMDQVTKVRFVGAGEVAVATHTSTTGVTVIVPSTAQSGAVTAVTASGREATWSGAITVIDGVVVVPQNFQTTAGATLTLSGTGLTQIKGVTVGNVAVNIAAQSATSISFVVPSNVPCGDIILRSDANPSIAGGSVVVGGGCNVRAARLEFAQILSQEPSDALLRLAAGKEAWVRAYMVSAAAGTASPDVRAKGFSAAGQLLGTLALAGPSTLPVLAPGATVPDSMRYDDATTFGVELPAAWVQPGLRVVVEAGDLANPSASIEGSPSVKNSGGLHVVLVPLVSGANAPTMPDPAAVASLLASRFPVPEESITVTTRAPYTLTSVTAGVISSEQWSAALSELERLRSNENRTAQYYGFVKPLVTSGTAGIGYVNRIGSTNPAQSSLGWDASRTSWTRTLVHELGHNMSRSHAPCGGVASADGNFPYAGGKLGPTPLFNTGTNRVVSPVGETDVMGYCGGSWFSDYNADGVRRFLEGRPAALQSIAFDGSALMLIVTGSVNGALATVDPTSAVMGDTADSVADAPNGSYVLRLTTRAGNVIEQRIEPKQVDHVEGEGHFIVRIPHPGPVSRIDIVKDGRAIASRQAAPSRATILNAERKGAQPVATPGPQAALVRRGNSVVLEWSDTEYPYASLAIVTAGVRRVLTSNATGGSWEMSAAAWAELPAAGVAELSLSDGVDAVVIPLAKP